MNPERAVRAALAGAEALLATSSPTPTPTPFSDPFAFSTTALGKATNTDEWQQKQKAEFDKQMASMQNSPTAKFVSYAAFPAGLLLAYHGYARNQSVGWALVWGVVGAAFWPIALPISLAQGFGKKG
jgi:hypothetical protein